jgi:hypothetical protein
MIRVKSGARIRSPHHLIRIRVICEPHFFATRIRSPETRQRKWGVVQYPKVCAFFTIFGFWLPEGLGGDFGTKRENRIYCLRRAKVKTGSRFKTLISMAFRGLAWQRPLARSKQDSGSKCGNFCYLLDGGATQLSTKERYGRLPTTFIPDPSSSNQSSRLVIE